MSTGEANSVPARDRIAIALFAALYLLRGLELISVETAVVNMLLVIFLYQLFSD